MRCDHHYYYQQKYLCWPLNVPSLLFALVFVCAVHAVFIPLYSVNLYIYIDFVIKTQHLLLIFSVDRMFFDSFFLLMNKNFAARLQSIFILLLLNLWKPERTAHCTLSILCRSWTNNRYTKTHTQRIRERMRQFGIAETAFYFHFHLFYLGYYLWDNNFPCFI